MRPRRRLGMTIRQQNDGISSWNRRNFHCRPRRWSHFVNHNGRKQAGSFQPLIRAAIRGRARQTRAESMRTIAFVTQKGGSGKSTLASSLAVAAKDVGERVCVIDLDPQSSLLSWAKTRELDDIGVVATTAGRLPALLSALEKKGVTLALIDTPGADGAASAAAMREADLHPARDHHLAGDAARPATVPARASLHAGECRPHQDAEAVALRRLFHPAARWHEANAKPRLPRERAEAAGNSIKGPRSVFRLRCSLFRQEPPDLSRLAVIAVIDLFLPAA